MINSKKSLINNFSVPFNVLNLIIIFSTLQISDISASEIFADSHIHYNWDHREETSTQEVVDILKQHNVGLTIVASTPSELALELRAKGGDWIIPFSVPIFTS